MSKLAAAVQDIVGDILSGSNASTATTPTLPIANHGGSIAHRSHTDLFSDGNPIIPPTKSKSGENAIDNIALSNGLGKNLILGSSTKATSSRAASTRAASFLGITPGVAAENTNRTSFSDANPTYTREDLEPDLAEAMVPR
jgi:hypothetical protein